ncbi:MAG: ABC transporter permease [Geminicoccaceae bacterium]|nr:ABC transporter permease [Geminicoccaceae bacterium]MCS7266889.1 ABC transporter permease [Geminicoccaceae bacterium]MCX7628846.1 ABC transporter permease [Geminicoccaceae bacterium]MDW8124187.1 ABC transporter permease [Geminicoccaceae bacterium]MDW8340590.1 ABC transporter permease [Geminicoccaceae bacterium]
MLGLILRRIGSTVIVMTVVALFVFAMLHLAPGDPAAVIAGDIATQEDIARIRSKLGLDRPLWEQFLVWLGHILTGDLGRSIFSDRPVVELIGQRIEPTLALATTTMLFSVIVAVPLGIFAAWRAGSWVDRLVMSFAVLGFSVPVFVFAYVLIIVFAVNLKWLPVMGYVSFRDDFGGFVRSIALPTLALGVTYIALIARITRASMLEVIHQDYIRTAHAKGLALGAVLFRHALKPASVPIVTTIGIGVALLIGGVVVTESVFAIPGVGRLTVDAILRRDYPIIQGVILIFSGIYVLINLVIDIVYTLLDPRIRY